MQDETGYSFLGQGSSQEVAGDYALPAYSVEQNSQRGIICPLWLEVFAENGIMLLISGGVGGREVNCIA